VVKSFDRLSGIYRALEYLAFGRTLEVVRFRYVEKLRQCRDIVIIGEGDGRFLVRLLEVARDARVRCIDSSPAMLARAARAVSAADCARVSFEQTDVRTACFEPGSCDAVVTLFVLDCFTSDDVVAVVRRLTASLRPGGLWLFGDFVIPASGWRRLRATVWVSSLYAFFRWQTGLPVRSLPPSEAILIGSGLSPVTTATFQHGLLEAILFRSAPPPARRD
jgi:SAM-dependent methyltransferase